MRLDTAFYFNDPIREMSRDLMRSTLLNFFNRPRALWQASDMECVSIMRFCGFEELARETEIDIESELNKRTI